MKKIIYLFYHHYNWGYGQSSAYRSALWAVLTLGMMNAFSLMLFVDFTLLKRYSYLNRRSWEENLLVACISYFILGYHVLWILYNKERIESIAFDPVRLKRGGRLLVSYIVISLALLLTAVKGYYGFNG